MSDFWKTIFIKFDTVILIFTIWHFQIDDQSKRTNQIIEIILRFHVTTHSKNEWINVLSFLQAKNNNVIHVIIEYAFNELIYDFKINDTFELLANLSSKNYNQFRQIKRENVEAIMIFAIAFSKARYDAVHKTIEIQIDDKIYFRLHQEYTILDLINHKLFNQKMKSFSILEKIDNLVFRFQLSSMMKIHSIIFIVQLKSIIKKSNSYDRVFNSKSSSIKKKNSNSASHYEIERLLKKRISRDEQVQYLIKWLKYESKHNVWYSLDALNNVDELIIEYETKMIVVESAIKRQQSTREIKERSRDKTERNKIERNKAEKD